MRKILVVVDMQNDFVTGALGTPEAQAMLPALLDYVEHFPGQIVFTLDTHGEDYLNSREGRQLPVVHCVKDTDGWKLVDPLQAFAQAHSCQIFCKKTFGSAELAQWLQTEHETDPIGEILLAGVCTDICVISNAMTIRSFLPEVPIGIVANCCAGVTPQRHQTALDAMESCQMQILSSNDSGASL